MGTTGDLAERFGVTKQTIRAWTAEFGDFLSQEANPPAKGKARAYNDADLEVMATVAHGRSQGRSFGDIRVDLAQGQTVPPGEVPPKTQPLAEFAPVGVLEGFARQLAAQYEGQIEHLENERDYLRDELDTERTARVDAEKAAATSQAKLDLLEPHVDALEAKIDALEAKDRRSLWDRIRGR